jgi:hypothetical protein
MLYKLEDGVLNEQPKVLEVDGKIYAPPSETILKEQGYKEMNVGDYPTAEYYESVVTAYSQDDDYIYKTYSLTYSADIADLYLAKKLEEMNDSLESDFTWEGYTVKLSESNQKDYLSAYTLALNQPDTYIPFEYTFKDNQKYTFDTMDEITSFTNSTMSFITTALEAYRTEKDTIDAMEDDAIYTYIQSLDE